MTAMANKALADWKQSRSPARPSVTAECAALSTEITSDMAICMVDAAVKEESGVVSFGAVLLSATGSFLSASSGMLACPLNPFMGEFMACRQALSWLKDKGIKQVMMMTDALQVVSRLTGNSINKDLSYIGSIAHECRSLFYYFDNFSISYVRRTANQLAHTLAKSVGPQAEILCWDITLRDCISHLLIA